MHLVKGVQSHTEWRRNAEYAACVMLQTTFYFGYTLTLCLGLAIMEGALGYIGASVFVRRIFRTIKAD